MMSKLFSVLPLLLLLSAIQASAGDGRREISQALVDEAGGFPYVLTEAGSYVLTSDLSVPSDTTAIAVAIPRDVSIDLNGFRIHGSHVCLPGNCAEGTSRGITGGSNTVVTGGQIDSFSGTCVQVGSGSRVHGMRVFGCGGHGISVGITSSVTHNIVSGAGLDGIRLADATGATSHNTVTLVGLAVAGLGIRGGRATGGNSCDDGSCSPGGRRTLGWDRRLDASNGDAGGCGSERFECVLPTSADPTGAAVLDIETGLVWDRAPTGGENIGRRDAMDFCAKREIGGRKGWHLPMLEQLASLIDPATSQPALPDGHPFQGIQNRLYWTATADANASVNIPNIGWSVNLGSGVVFNGAELNEGPATWCVRGGRAFDGNTQR